MKRFARLIVVLLVLSLCGPAMAKTPIRLVTYGTAETMERFSKIADAFNASHPTYELQVEIYPFAEYPTKIQVMVAGGTPPDVMLTWAQYKPLWAQQGLIMDVESYWNKSAVAKNARIFPFMLEAGTYKGRIYGVPYDYSAQTMILNLDALSRAGLPEPGLSWTVDDFKRYAIRLTRPTEGMYGVLSGGHWSTNSYQWTILYTGKGWLNNEGTETHIEDATNINMLEMWYDLMHQYQAAPLIGQSPTRDVWQGGYAMWQGFAHYGARLESSPYDWAIAPFPRGPGGQKSFAHGHMWSIPTGAANPSLSWTVLEWFLTAEGQRTIVEVDKRQPLTSSSSLWNQFFANVSPAKRGKLHDLVINVLYSNNDMIHNMTYWPIWSQVERVMNTNLTTIFRDQVPPANAMAKAATEIRGIIKDQK